MLETLSTKINSRRKFLNAMLNHVQYTSVVKSLLSYAHLTQCVGGILVLASACPAVDTDDMNKAC